MKIDQNGNMVMTGQEFLQMSRASCPRPPSHADAWEEGFRHGVVDGAADAVLVAGGLMAAAAGLIIMSNK